MQATSRNFEIGCSDIQFMTKKETVICARNMDFPTGMDSELTFHNREEKFTSKAPDGSTGLQWASKHGFVSVNAFGKENADEGMNENGLSFGILSLPGSVYQKISSSEADKALAISMVGFWILGNFETVKEVEAALPNVLIWGDFIDPFSKETMGLHIALHDATGKNLVIEFIDGKAVVSEGIGVLTNEPPLSAHLQGLRKYNSLNSGEAPDVHINGKLVPSLGGEDMMVGLPGGWSSPTRFIRAATLLRLVSKVKTAMEGVNLACKILNSVAVIKGVSILKAGDLTFFNVTRWSAIKDLTNRIFYWRSCKNSTLRMLNFSKIDFNPGTKHTSIPVCAGDPTIIDMTDKV